MQKEEKQNEDPKEKKRKKKASDAEWKEEEKVYLASVAKRIMQKKRDEPIVYGYDKLEKFTVHESVQILWRGQLMNQVNAICDAAPWKKREEMRAYGKEKIKSLARGHYLPGHGGSGEISEIFEGDMNQMFRSIVHVDGWLRRLTSLI